MEFSQDVKDYLYTVIGIEKNASQEEIEKYFENLPLSKIRWWKEIFKQKHEHTDLMNLSTKLLGNSLYGASGNKYFYFFNTKLSDTITSEGRGTIHYMETYLTNFFCHVLPFDENLAAQFGVKFKSKAFIETTNFYKNQEALVYGDTDSLYVNYGGLFDLMTEDTVPQTDLDKINWIVDFNKNYLDRHNKEVLRKWIDEERHGKSIHNFELETISAASINLAKKKYILAIKWKDGKLFDKPKIKPKGIEMIQSSTPQFCRKYLKDLSEMLLLTNTSELKSTFNVRVGEIRKNFMEAPIESISCSVNVGEVNKYLLELTDIQPVFGKQTPVSVQAAGWYNWIIKKTKRENICKPIQQGDKIKFYVTHGIQMKSGKFKNQKYFGYPAGEYPEWIEKFMPINRAAQFEKTFLAPINRLTAAVGLPIATGDGAVMMTLF